MWHRRYQPSKTSIHRFLAVSFLQCSSALGQPDTCSLYDPPGPVIPSEYPNCPMQTCTTADGFTYYKYDCFTPSFDGYTVPTFIIVPADVKPPMPLLVMLHSWGDDRSFYLGSPLTTIEDEWNAVAFARKGYTVLLPTSRGHFDSPSGLAGSVLNPDVTYWARFNDPARDVRDIQELITKLVTQQLALPGSIGTTGECLGGGQSWTLALLRDKIMTGRLKDGTPIYEPWETVDGTSISIAAAIPWQFRSSLMNGLLPNGRMNDNEPAEPQDLNCPVGVPLEQFWSLLFLMPTVELAPADTDPEADFQKWYDRMTEGDPYFDDSVTDFCTPSDSTVAQMVTQFDRRSLLFFREPTTSVPISPVYQVMGLTDSLAPAGQALQMLLHYPDYPIKTFLGNLHHFWGAVDSHWAVAREDGFAFFDYHLRGVGKQPASDITVLTTDCSANAQSQVPTARVATAWSSFASTAITRHFNTQQVTRNPSPDDPAFNPLANEFAPNCMTIPVAPDTNEDGIAFWQFTEPCGFSLIGSPTVTVAFNTDGKDVQFNAILWKLEPAKAQKTLVTFGTYRHLDTPNPTGGSKTIQYQLNPNAWEFDAGTTLRLEIRSDARPHFKPNNVESETVISSVSLSVPVESFCHADLNCDGTVNVNDVLLLLHAWALTETNADIDGNGTVNVNDLLLLIGAWGPCP